jgi:hypothetical protein
MKKMQKVNGLPDNTPSAKEGTLAYLELQGVGPAKRLSFELAERLNIITGDNGLGKTFLLECAWWALRGLWAGPPAYPRPDAKADEPKITFQISTKSTKPAQTSISYDWQNHTWQSWSSPKERSTIPGLLIYARVDGSFAVWDPTKDYWLSTDMRPFTFVTQNKLVFNQEQVWEGIAETVEGKTWVYINGLLRDWVTWQNKPEKYPFDTFKKVLHRLSPPDVGDLGLLEPGTPVRLPYDAREIPTLKHPNGEVPIVHTSAGVRRIITIAYLIVWAWEEHKAQSRLTRSDPQKQMVILVDEMEAHLHPQWQRVILPALLDVSEELDPELQVQFLIATHSPLVLASVEPKFNPEIDKLFHLDIVQRGLESEVELQELPFVPHGPVDSWLMSDVFKLRHARSLEAEVAIEEAKALQLQDEPEAEKVKSVSDKLVKYLAADDEFWPRWKYFAEQYGVRFDPHPSTT